MNIQDIKELLLTIDKTSIQKVDIEQKDIKISISKGIDVDCTYKTNEMQEVKTQMNPSVEEDEKIEINTDDTYIVKSPIVGVVYMSPSPDADPFVSVGDTVTKGEPLCIIEAMKIMNEIQSEEEGQIVEILVKNEDLVEYGQPLMRIRR
ncbi:acetyl-CoA carboxylase biotin carboxyl carrier protein [Inediibacterium massiliense]|uniref:acetyl-CoA carboxylase biotin carboxyl carrier protein n=1 Tax=Inediibacterium massiliense TaxID=1658111 RepID=UPI0006B565DB|nr:acetyl-CoA carboxylase biotin carboxyl carrier protein [Inediibacterium massiliense]